MSEAAPAATSQRKRRAPSQWDVAPTDAGSSSLPSHQTRHARRLYVGGVGDAGEKEIEEYFASLARGSCLRPALRGAEAPNPILSVYVNAERKFAFVEFSTLELANTFADFDGLLFRGAPLRVRRPDDFDASALTAEQRERKEPVDLSALPLSQPPSTAASLGGGGSGGHSGGGGGGGGGGRGMAGGAGAPNPHRLYIGNIPGALTEVQLRELVSAFGAIHKLDVPRQPDGGMRGYAFAEYADAAVTDVAISALDGLAVGDKRLSVSRAKTAAGGGGPIVQPPPPPPPLLQQQQQQQQAAGGGLYGAAVAAAAAQRLVVLDNMVLAEEVATESSFREILEEIATECSQSGSLQDLKIPRPPEPGAGRVFLVYADGVGAQQAIMQLHGRQFSGRSIQGRLYDEQAFRSGVLTL